MRGNELLDSMDLVDPAYVEEAENYVSIRCSTWKRGIAIAAGVLLIVGVFCAGPLISRLQGRVMKGSEDDPKYAVVTRVELSDVPLRNESLSEALTEQEIFDKWNTTIVRGYVSDVYNVEIDFDGVKVYGAVVSVRVKKVFRGECTAGDTVNLFLEYPLDLSDDGTGIWVEDTGVIARVRAGMEGIFMMLPYGEDETWTKNDCTLNLRSVARYHLPDGERFAFLETDDGLVFHEETFESIAGATTLTEVEEYVRRMLP